jgi:hypothetical protein
MVGINNNNYTSQVPSTFGNGSNNYQTNTTQQTQNVNPFQGGDKYSVDSTSQAFDQAMAKLTGQNVFTNQTTNTQQTQMTTQNTGAPQLPAGVTQSDMNWALALEEKVKGGYTPTQQETQVYQNIAAKLSAAMSNPTGNTQTQQTTQTTAPTQNMGISQEELNWAISVENAVKGGYTPTPQETQAYQNIAAKMAAAKNQSTQQTQQTTQTTAPTQNMGISQDELNWAIAIEDKVKQGYKPTNEETQAYQNIAAKMAAAKNQSTQQAGQLPAGVSQQEIDWALQLETKVKGGYTPTQQETQAYQGIAAKMAAAKNQPTQQAGQLPAGVSQQEIDWALQLETKVKGGYTPTQQETQAYQALAAKISSSQTTQQTPSTQSTQQAGQLPAGVSQQEIDWALQLETKVKGGYTPTQQETQAYQALAAKISSSNNKQAGVTQAPQVTQQEIDWALALEAKVKGGYTATPDETATYQNIAHKLQAQQQSGNTGNQNGKDWQAWSQPFSVPRNLFQTTPRIIQVPATLRSSSSTLPTYTVANNGPSLGNTANVPKTLTTGKTANVSNAQVPSKSEIDWALQLEEKVKKGYTPNESELYQYKNIADRLAASQGKPTSQPTGTQNQQTVNNGNTQTEQKSSIGQRLSNAWTALTK